MASGVTVTVRNHETGEEWVYRQIDEQTALAAVDFNALRAAVSEGLPAREEFALYEQGLHSRNERMRDR